MIKTFQELIDKYPKIFSLMGDPYYRVSSGFPDNWLQTLDWMCESIQEHIDNINIHNKHLPPVEQLVCKQVKDKFGELRFYFNGGDKECEGMVKMAETILWNTCELCGDHENLHTTTGWIRRVCDNCLNKERNGRTSL